MIIFPAIKILIMSKQVSEKTEVEEIMPDLNTRYAYVLAVKNEPRGRVYDEHGHKRNEIEYKPFMNVLLRSSIVWKGEKDPFSGKERKSGKYQIRYYDGCTTLFVDDQPREKDTLDGLISATRELTFDHGYLFIYGYDTMLKMYMDWASYNEDSPYRIPNSVAKFKNVNTEKQMEVEAALLEIEDNARDLAKNADPKKMRIHAKYLGVPLVDHITQIPLSVTAIRTEYRKFAKANPKHFIKSYNDKTIEINTWVTDALNSGQISTSIMPNNAVWAKSGVLICGLDGLRAQNLIIDRIVEVTQTEEGGDTLAQLKALYN